MRRYTKYTKELLEPLVRESISVAEVVRKLNLKFSGSNHQHIRRKIDFFKIDTSHFLGQRSNLGKSSYNKKHWTEILIIKHNNLNGRTASYKLRRALLESGREYKCVGIGCNLTDQWLGKEIRLQVNHKNGNFIDNRSDNLEFLCPNCHSQTIGWAGSKGYTDIFSPKRKKPKNLCKCGNFKQNTSNVCINCRKLNKKIKVRKIRKNKIDWPSKEKLEKLVWRLPATQIAKQLGVSDKAVEKHCKKYGIQKPPRGYWAKKNVLEKT